MLSSLICFEFIYLFTYLEGERYGSSSIQDNLLNMLPFLEYGCLLACFATLIKN